MANQMQEQLTSQTQAHIQAVLAQMQAMQSPLTDLLIDYHRVFVQQCCQRPSDIDAPAVRAWSGAPGLPQEQS